MFAKSVWLIGAVLIGGCSSSAPERYDASAFYSTTSYTVAEGFAWSADGQKLLLTSDESGIANAYALSMTGAAKAALTGSTTDSTYAVSWFPGDARALVRADRGGNELMHLYVRESSGALRDLMPDSTGKADFLGWAADGSSFYVLSNERDPKTFDLYRYSVQDYTRSLVFKNQLAWEITAISGDGRYLALVKNHSSADSDIYLLDVSSGESAPQLITKHTGEVAYSASGFTPDSGKLIYSTDEHGEFRQAWTYDVATAAKSLLVKADWDVRSVSFSASGRYLVWSINQDARTVTHIRDTQTNAEVVLPKLPKADVLKVYFSRDEQRLALVLGSDISPNDIYSVDLNAGTSKRLTHALNPKIREDVLVMSQVVRYQSFDGLQIPALLYRPKLASATQRVPAVVWVHGGPGGQSRTGYSAMIQHLVNHGYAVLAANNRGSSGYGKTFFHSDDKRHGDVDLQDIVHAKQYLAGLDWVDGQRVGIMGHSYGGYMVGAALAFSPQTFNAGIDIFGVMNWARTLSSVPPWWEAQKKSIYDEMGDPATDAERHRRISPLFHAKNIRAPLLVVQGKNDP
ncbi:S9 family peptidase, partial [Steroidobacter sp.]|uniref:S9 family peptidase n=1 Tax=Steroidobacter sp. TaxID=1978227 RepID=UPI001A4AA079